MHIHISRLQKPFGSNFGFGGKLSSFNNKPKAGGIADVKKSSLKSPVVKLSQIVEDTTLMQSCDAFHAAVATGRQFSFILLIVYFTIHYYYYY
jgi:hypothetical protein